MRRGKKKKRSQIRKLISCRRFNFCMQPTITFLKASKPSFRSFKLQLNTELIPKKAIEVLLCERHADLPSSWIVDCFNHRVILFARHHRCDATLSPQISPQIGAFFFPSREELFYLQTVGKFHHLYLPFIIYR